MPKRETVTFEDTSLMEQENVAPSIPAAEHVDLSDAAQNSEGSETDDSEYDDQYDQMSTLVDLLTNDDGENVVDALVKALGGIQGAVENNTRQLEKMTKEVKRRSKSLNE